VIVGCGFGGLSAAKALRRADVYVTVIDGTIHARFTRSSVSSRQGILSENESEEATGR
jgi:NADH:ubiquinone reductase (H+-translocating)